MGNKLVRYDKKVNYKAGVTVLLSGRGEILIQGKKCYFSTESAKLQSTSSNDQSEFQVTVKKNQVIIDRGIELEFKDLNVRYHDESIVPSTNLGYREYQLFNSCSLYTVFHRSIDKGSLKVELASDCNAVLPDPHFSIEDRRRMDGLKHYGEITVAEPFSTVNITGYGSFTINGKLYCRRLEPSYEKNEKYYQMLLARETNGLVDQRFRTVSGETDLSFICDNPTIVITHPPKQLSIPKNRAVVVYGYWKYNKPYTVVVNGDAIGLTFHKLTDIPDDLRRHPIIMLNTENKTVYSPMATFCTKFRVVASFQELVTGAKNTCPLSDVMQIAMMRSDLRAKHRFDGVYLKPSENPYVVETEKTSNVYFLPSGVNKFILKNKIKNFSVQIGQSVFRFQLQDLGIKINYYVLNMIKTENGFKTWRRVNYTTANVTNIKKSITKKKEYARYYMNRGAILKCRTCELEITQSNRKLKKITDENARIDNLVKKIDFRVESNEIVNGNPATGLQPFAINAKPVVIAPMLPTAPHIDDSIDPPGEPKIIAPGGPQ